MYESLSETCFETRTNGLVEKPRESSLRGVRRGGRRGNLNSLGDIQYEIAALPSVARNDNQRNFVNTPERPGHPAPLEKAGVCHLGSRSTVNVVLPYLRCWVISKSWKSIFFVSVVSC